MRVKFKEELVLVIQHNLSAMNISRNMSIVNSALSKSMERLSSGYRINRASDDPAGLSISERMRSQIRALNQAARNAQDGQSLVQVAEGGLNETHSILQRMNELATQAANDINTTVDRNSIQNEVDALTSEISRIRSATQFNTMNLLDGSYSGRNLQIGSLVNQSISVTISDMSASSIGVTGLSMSSFDTAGSAISKIQSAIDIVSGQRSALGALYNRLDYTIDNLNTTSENLQAAESRIRDTDIASEMLNYSRNSILAQVGEAMLAQVKRSNKDVLFLLTP